MGSKDGASPLISLSLILLKGGHVAGVSVGQASNGYGNIAPGWLHLYNSKLKRSCTGCCLSQYSYTQCELEMKPIKELGQGMVLLLKKLCSNGSCNSMSVVMKL